MRRITIAIALVVAAQPFVPAVPAAAGTPPAGSPATVSRSVEVGVDRLVPAEARGATGLSAPAGTLRASREIVTRPATLCSPIWFTAVALTWQQHSKAHVHAAVAAGPSARSLGSAVDVTADPADAPGPSTPDYDPDARASGLLWTGGARCVRFSLELHRGADVAGLEAVFINTSGTAAGPGTTATTTAPPSASTISYPAAGRRPSMVTRKQWGADPAYFNTGSSGCEAPYYADEAKVAYVHHTAGSNDYSADESDDIVRAIYYFHTQGRGYCDIAYNFLVDRFGTIFVGRKGGVARAVIPGSQMGFNPGTFSVSTMGNWDAARPPAEMVDAVQRLISWRLDVAHLPPLGFATLVSEGGSTTRYEAGTPVTLPTITGHKETGYTACPGVHLYAVIPAIREAVAADGPRFFGPAASAAHVTPGADSIRFTARSAAPLTWRVDVVADGGVHASRWSHGTTLDLVWDGTDGDRVPLVPGVYTAVIRATGPGGKGALPARFPVAVNPPAR